MKKHVGTLLCAVVLLLCALTPPALADGGPYYPISVEEYTAGVNELRVKKVYQLSLSDDPAGIPTEDFERNGRRFYLLDMVKEDEVGVDTRDHTETITKDSDTKDLSKILKQLDAHKEATTEDGYTGLLALDYTSVTVKAKGYKTKTKSLSATRTYPNLSDADLSLVPKTITDSGKTLNLGAVEWSGGEGEYYTATATYSGTSSTRYATGYTETANYTGKVAKTECSVVTYTAIFGSVELPAEEPPTEEPSAEPSEQPNQDEQTEPDSPDNAAVSLGITDWISLIGGVGGIAALAAAVLLTVQNLRRRRD